MGIQNKKANIFYCKANYLLTVRNKNIQKIPPKIPFQGPQAEVSMKD